jgi:DNA repair exonuclease SbcCD nuclease subunit
VKIALITDTHFGARNDSTPFLDYFDKFYSEVFFPYLDDNNIDCIVHLGDIVDRRKYISYVTLRRMKAMFIDQCEKRNIDLHIIIGNHDVPFRNTNEINSMKELFQNTSVNYYSNPETVKFGGNEILLMPWINNSNFAEAQLEMHNTKAQVMFGHLEVAGAMMDRGNRNDHGLPITTFDKFDIVYSGHFHHKNKIGNVQYLGCPYEITWIDYQDPKGFHIYDTEERSLDFQRNPYSMFHKLFYSDDGKDLEDILKIEFNSYSNTYVKVIKQNCENPYWFDVFMEELSKANPLHIQVVDDNLNLNLESNSEIIDEAEDTLTIMSKYIKVLPDNVPKKKLDLLMSSLYNEALTLNL